jgi:hypothetical protein
MNFYAYLHQCFPKARSARRAGLTLLGAVALGSAGCNAIESLQGLNYRVTAVTEPKGVSMDFCTDPPTPQKFNLKMVVILDHSGSNKQNYLMSADGSGSPALVNGAPVIKFDYATDPLGKTRYGDVNTPGTLLNYLYNTPVNDPKNPSRFYALIDFGNQASTYPPNSSGFTADVEGFYRYVQADAQGQNPDGLAPADSGSTSYLSALNSTYNIINNDIQAAQACAGKSPTEPPTSACPNPGVQVTSSYVIVFMSDGSPIIQIQIVGTDASGNVVATGNVVITKEPTGQILNQVAAIVGLGANSRYVAGINLFTIYYYYPGNVDLSGQSILANMATVGNGIAYNALSNSNIDYSRFTPPAKLISYSLSDIFVTNSSLSWWTDGKLYADTDRDGLPDVIETQWGSDPTRADTDGNGVSDLVEYRIRNGAACGQKNAAGLCLDPAVNYATGACAGVSRTFEANGRIKFRASDPNGLNDCEKILLKNGSGINNPDSNGDFIPDWLEFKNGLSFQVGSLSAVNSFGLDGMSFYHKIKSSLPVSLSIDQLNHFPSTTYNLARVTSPPNQDCYRLDVDNLPTLGDGNTVRVDVMMKSDLEPDRYLYRVGEKAFSAGSKALHFGDWNDAGEANLGTWKRWPE